jgi:hypothetical protein
MSKAKRSPAFRQGGADRDRAREWVPADWARWHQALDHIKKVVGPTLAEFEIRPKLLLGEVRWVDRYVGPDGKCETREVPADADWGQGPTRTRHIWTDAIRSETWNRERLERGGGSHNVFIFRADLNQFWPLEPPLEAVGDGVGPKSTRKRGRKPAYDWDAITAEVLRRVHDDGIPDNFVAFGDAILNWCEDKFNKAPEESTLRKKLRLWFERIERTK